MDKKSQKTCNGEKKTSSINDAGLTGSLYIKMNENRFIFIMLYKAQVQVDKNLNIKPDILNQIEEKVGKSVELIGMREIT